MNISSFFRALVVLLFAWNAHAWGPATHAYLAKQVSRSEISNILFGAMMPDLANLMFPESTQGALSGLLHREYDRMPESELGLGLMTHNAVWGADYYAHLFFNPSAEEIYSTRKIREISAGLGVTASRAEDIFELVIDYHVRLDYGRALGPLLIRVASSIGPAEEQMYIDAYLPAMMERVTGLPESTVEQGMRDALRGFCAALMFYGAQLNVDEPAMLQTIPGYLAAYLGCSKDTAREYFLFASDLCEDYQPEMERIAANLRDQIEPMPEYAVPVGSAVWWAGAFLLILLGAGYSSHIKRACFAVQRYE